MQKYVFVANDSADNYPVCNEAYDNFFNCSWTYRFDSTISYQFFSIYNKQYEKLGSHFQWYRYKDMKPADASLRAQFVSKSKAALIFLDKCKTRSKRENLIQSLKVELSKYKLIVDVFGDCGLKQCKKKKMNPCFWRLRKTHYFYLAFEDSVSYDYVTDIVLYACNFNAIPVVYGRARYEKYLPPGSYVNALNVTTDTLAETMYDIINNKSKYFDFFRWKNHYTFRKALIVDGCQLCDMLNSPARLVQKGYYGRLRRWWNPLYETRCNVRTNQFIAL